MDNIDTKNEKLIKFQNKIDFTEVIDMCKRYLNEEISIEQLKEWGNKIVFISYLPIQIKIELINKLILQNDYDDNVELRMIQLELYKFYEILLSYTNIEIKNNDLKTIENYDICESVLGTWFLTCCGIDYQKIENLCNNYLSINNLDSLIKVYNNLKDTSFDKYSKQQMKIFKYLKKNPEILKDMSSILQFNDPQIKKIIDKISLDALSQ